MSVVMMTKEVCGGDGDDGGENNGGEVVRDDVWDALLISWRKS